MSDTNVKLAVLVLLKGTLPRQIERELMIREKLNPQIEEFNFLHYPFLFSNEDKADILKIESYLSQDSQIEATVYSQGFDLLGMPSKANFYLELKIDR